MANRTGTNSVDLWENTQKDGLGDDYQVVVDSNGKIKTVSDNADYALILDDTTTANVTYIGKADIGSATSSAVWQIKKIDETGNMTITWADGDNSFDNVWDNRASLTYS